MSTEYERLRQGVRDYRTRSAMIAAAVDEPQTYLEPALKMLDERSDILRWCAIRILADIGDERAVAPLKALRDSGRHAVEIADALRAITGQEPESAVGGRSQGDHDVSDPSGMSDAALLREALRGLPATVTGESPHYTVYVSLTDGRSQEVYMDFSRTDPDDQAIVYLWTSCGAVDPEKYASALKLNMIIPYGAIGIAEVEDDTCFAMVNTYLRETANPREIGFSVMTLAREGDSIERALCRQD